jgi:alkylation response protein AidB-like acyl-CoA dehydrogenase
MLPHAARWDEEEFFPVETLRKLAELGFGGPLRERTEV